jgi:hypothetical protein
MPYAVDQEAGFSHDPLAKAPSRILIPKAFAALDEVPSEPPWLWEGMVAPGLVTMLSAPAFAGKSTLVGGLLRALDSGSDFLGLGTRSGAAVLVSEEPAYALRARRDRFGLGESGSFYLGREDVAGHLWPELITATTEWALETDARLLVVDSFAGLAGLQEEQENDAAAVMKALKPLEVSAASGLAVLFLHHTNRQGRARGSTAFGAAADIAIRLVSKQNNQFELQTESRFQSSPPRLAGRLHQAPDGWFYEVVAGTARGATPKAESRTEDLLLAALEQAGCDGLSYDDFNALPGLSEDIAKKKLPGRIGNGIERKGRGVKGDKLRYVIAASC